MPYIEMLRIEPKTFCIKNMHSVTEPQPIPKYEIMFERHTKPLMLLVIPLTRLGSVLYTRCKLQAAQNSLEQTLFREGGGWLLDLRLVGRVTAVFQD